MTEWHDTRKRRSDSRRHGQHSIRIMVANCLRRSREGTPAGSYAAAPGGRRKHYEGRFISYLKSARIVLLFWFAMLSA